MLPSLPSPLETFSPPVRRALRVDISATLLLTVFACMTGPFTGLILRREMGASAFQISVMQAAGAAFMLLSLAWARAVEGREPLACVVWTGFVARGLFLLVPFIHSAWPFVALLVAVNLLGTIAGPAQTVVIERVYPQGERGRALGLVKTAGGMPGILLLLGAGTLLDRIDYRFMFPAAALVGMAASLRLRSLPVPDAPMQPGCLRTGLSEAWAVVRDNARFRRLLIASFVFGCGIWLQMPANPLLMVDVLDVSVAQMGVFAAISGVAGLTGNACWGRLADRRTTLRALRVVYLVGATTPVLYFMASSPWVLALTSVTESLMNTGLDLVFTMALIEVAGPSRSAHYAAIAATLAGVRGVLGPLLGALVIGQFGVQAVYPLAAALMACAVVMVTREIAHRTSAASR
jgi:predicted MFS family arabinose efflux permease